LSSSEGHQGTDIDFFLNSTWETVRGGSSVRKGSWPACLWCSQWLSLSTALSPTGHWKAVKSPCVGTGLSLPNLVTSPSLWIPVLVCVREKMVALTVLWGLTDLKNYSSI
jgi:hypothetical protein